MAAMALTASYININLSFLTVIKHDKPQDEQVQMSCHYICHQKPFYWQILNKIMEWIDNYNHVFFCGM